MATPLNKNSGVTVPDWMIKSQLPNMDVKEASKAISVKSDEDLVEIRSRIEKSAENGGKVYIEQGASDSQKSQLREYAQVVGLDPSSIVEVSKYEKDMASRTTVEEKAPETPKTAPFGGLDSFADESSFKPNRDWDSVKPASKTTDYGRSVGTVGRADSSTETYEAQRVIGVRPGEASIAAPNAIEELSKSKEQTSVQKIRDANAKRRDKISFDKPKWEAEAIEGLPPSGTIAKGGIKLTDAGVQSPHQQVGKGQHSIFDDGDNNKKIPKMTKGELLSEKNERRKEAIQRPVTEDRSWDTPKSSKSKVMGDVFFEALKKQMSSVGKTDG